MPLRPRRLGLNTTAVRVTPGATSLRISSHFPINDGSKLVKPVMLPSGFGMLATKWLPTGSDTPTNTIGMVRVSRSSAAAAGVKLPTRISGLLLIQLCGLLRERRCVPAIFGVRVAPAQDEPRNGLNSTERNPPAAVPQIPGAHT